MNRKITLILFLFSINIYPLFNNFFSDAYSVFKQHKSYITFTVKTRANNKILINADTLGSDPVYYSDFNKYNVNDPAFSYGVSGYTKLVKNISLYFNFVIMPLNLSIYDGYYNYAEESYNVSVDYNFSQYLTLYFNMYMKNYHYIRNFNEEEKQYIMNNSLNNDIASSTYDRGLRMFTIGLRRRKWNRILPTLEVVFYNYEKNYYEAEQYIPDSQDLWTKLYNYQDAKLNVKIKSKLELYILKGLGITLRYNYTPVVESKQRYPSGFRNSWYSITLNYGINKHFDFATTYSLSRYDVRIYPLYKTYLWQYTDEEYPTDKQYRNLLSEGVSYDNQLSFSLTFR